MPKFTYFIDPLDRGYLENELNNRGFFVIGVDEVGRGCLAGPLYAAACCFDWGKIKNLPAKQLDQLIDSKKLSASKRMTVEAWIRELTLAHATAAATVEEIEHFGLTVANDLAMERAIAQVILLLRGLYSADDTRPIVVLVDGNRKIATYAGEQLTLVRGDFHALNIAGASILAKNKRDELMHDLDKTYPGYGFSDHVGYGTKKHLDALKALGPSPIHRANYAPVKEAYSLKSL